MKRPLGAAAQASILLVAIGSVAADPAVSSAPESSEFDRVVVHPPGKVAIRSVSIENGYGSVEVEGHDESGIVVEARKRAGNDAVLKRLSVALTPEPGGSVRIGTSFETETEMKAVAAGSAGIDLRIRVPRSARPLVHIWKGKVVISGLDNGAEVEAHEATVDMRHVSGSISSHIALGRQQFRELVGASIAASSLDGDVSLDTVQGDTLDAWAHRGDLHARRIRFRQLSLRTVRGDIYVAGGLMPGGSYELSSYYGNVELVSDREAPVRIQIIAAGGHVSLPDEMRARLMSAHAEPIFFASNARGETPSVVRIRSRLGDVRFTMVRAERP